MTRCSVERLLVPGDHDPNVPALRRILSRVASRHTREGLPGRPKTETGQLGCQLGCQTAFRPTVGSRFCL